MRAVLDTNVFISGIFWRGESSKTIDHWRKGNITLVSSKEIITEIETVLLDFKIALPEDLIKEWSKTISERSILVEPKEKVNAVIEDPDDNKFIEAALEAKAEFIVTQDKHLLKIKEYRGIRILTPKEFNKVF